MTTTAHAAVVALWHTLRERAEATRATGPALAPDVLGLPPDHAEDQAADVLARALAAARTALPPTAGEATRTALQRMHTAATHPGPGELLHSVLGMDAAAPDSEAAAALAAAASRILDACTDDRAALLPPAAALLRVLDADDRAAIHASGLTPDAYAAALAAAGLRARPARGITLAEAAVRARASAGAQTPADLLARAASLDQRATALEDAATTETGAHCTACRHLRRAAEEAADAAHRLRRAQLRADPVTGLPAGEAPRAFLSVTSDRRPGPHTRARF